jgi:hypothetical protein
MRPGEVVDLGDKVAVELTEHRLIYTVWHGVISSALENRAPRVRNSRIPNDVANRPEFADENNTWINVESLVKCQPEVGAYRVHRAWLHSCHAVQQDRWSQLSDPVCQNPVAHLQTARFGSMTQPGRCIGGRQAS